MKAFTDIEQSMKLKEILSIENADMYWLNRHIDLTETKYEIFVVDKSNKYIDFFKSYAVAVDNNEIIPCWSLAALLEVIPKEVEIKGQRYAPCLFPIIDGHWLYKLWYNSNEIIESPIAVWCDNPVDACYEMILKLHEQKLL